MTPSEVMLIYRPCFIIPVPAAVVDRHRKIVHVNDTVATVDDTAVDDTVAAADEEIASDYGIDYSSFSEYVPSELEGSMCEEEVFVVCPESDCHALHCFEHRQTDCGEHKETGYSAARVAAAAKRLRDYTTDDETDNGVDVSQKSAEIKKTKRIRNEKQWRRIRSKKPHKMGQEYVTSTGRIVAAKGVPEGVVCGEVSTEMRHKNCY